MKSTDIAVVADLPNGKMILHRADCPVARKCADAGIPVMTMYGVEKPLTEEGWGDKDNTVWHSCLTGEQDESR